jgi:NADH-quinone oxidoreductase subunit B
MKKFKRATMWVSHPYKWGQKYSLWPIQFCTGCGSIEIPPTMLAPWDASRFGMGPMATPRQANLLMITGYLTPKTLKAVIRTYEQMLTPKYVVAFGSCPIDGGMYYMSYNTINHLDWYLAVDVWIAGCMPRPEAVLMGFNKLMEMIETGEADGYIRYEKNLDYYRKNQERTLGKDFVESLKQLERTWRE